MDVVVNIKEAVPAGNRKEVAEILTIFLFSFLLPLLDSMQMFVIFFSSITRSGIRLAQKKQIQRELCSYRSLNAIVAQPKNFPFGINTTLDLKNTTTISDNDI